MKHRLWIVRRQTVSCPDAQLRWDRAYQSLVMWSCRQNAKPSDSEEHHEDCPVCTGFQHPASPDPNHRRATVPVTHPLPEPALV